MGARYRAASGAGRTLPSMETTAPAVATWPPRYRIHKYWSRKPADLVARRIEAASEPGDLVLDPFCGSGVAPIEAAALGRSAIGVDVNPFAVFLARATAGPCDADALAAAGERVLVDAARQEGRWHETRCRRCSGTARRAAAVTHRGALVAVVVRCPRCGGSVREEPDAADRSGERASALAGDGGAPRPPVFAGWQTRKLIRAGIADFGELFEPANLRAFAAIRRAIADEPDATLRPALEVALTGALAQGSRMIADSGTAGGGPSWKLNIYWLPERRLALDPFRCFANRLARVVAARHDADALLGDRPRPRFVCADARQLAEVVEPGSVAHVFADPPYGGEGIQYGELSALWCAWLDPPLEPALAAEIGENPAQGRDAATFASGLAEAFRAVRGVLAEDGSMTVTFASSDARSWAALRAALGGAGFAVAGSTEVARSAPGLTERTTGGSTRADVWLDCRVVPLPA
jgi:16S rRNA G966 N2-methylase RsmD